MDRHDEEIAPDRPVERAVHVDEGETHASTGGAAAAGAVTGGVIGLAGGPVGAAIGAVGGAIIGVAAERMMHSDDDNETDAAHYVNEQHVPTTDVAVASTDITLKEPPVEPHPG